MRTVFVVVLLLSLAQIQEGTAQDARLRGRVPQAALPQVEAVLDSARAEGLPTEPLVDRALEGASKRAPPDRIVAAVRRLAGELRLARAALGASSTDAEIVAGASALRAGAPAEELARLRARRGGRSLLVPAAVLADLVAVGVPVDAAIAAVIALADGADDAQFIAFRRNVERDIGLGASPVTALGVRSQIFGVEAPTPPRPPGPRKP